MITIDNISYYTTKEVAQKFNVTPKTIIDWVDNGWLKCKKLGVRKFIYSDSDIKLFLERK